MLMFCRASQFMQPADACFQHLRSRRVHLDDADFQPAKVLPRHHQSADHAWCPALCSIDHQLRVFQSGGVSALTSAYSAGRAAFSRLEDAQSRGTTTGGRGGSARPWLGQFLIAASPPIQW
jgi:hypothetical protein